MKRALVASTSAKNLATWTTVTACAPKTWTATTWNPSAAAPSVKPGVSAVNHAPNRVQPLSKSCAPKVTATSTAKTSTSASSSPICVTTDAVKTASAASHVAVIKDLPLMRTASNAMVRKGFHYLQTITLASSRPTDFQHPFENGCTISFNGKLMSEMIFLCSPANEWHWFPLFRHQWMQHYEGSVRKRYLSEHQRQFYLRLWRRIREHYDDANLHGLSHFNILFQVSPNHLWNLFKSTLICANFFFKNLLEFIFKFP